MEEKLHEQKLDALCAKLEAVEKNTRRRNGILRWISACCVICTLAILLAVGILVPRFVRAMNGMQDLYANVEAMTAGIDEGELGTLAEEISQLAEDADTSVTEAGAALARLNELDIETLNQAISNLNATVEPLAEFFGKFQR